MDITFTKKNNLWVAEFQVSGNFNLHLERVESGSIRISQKTAGNGYALINDAHSLYSQLVIDVDIQGIVFPKTIQISSVVKPTVAIVTEA